LGGGQGTAWLAGEVVLKPADVGREELQWQARIHSQVRCDGFRLSRVRTAIDGSLCAEGWYATQYLAGWHGQRRSGPRADGAALKASRPGSRTISSERCDGRSPATPKQR
jgi:hypothetical protein